MGKLSCDICEEDFNDYKLYRQHRIEHIKKRDWTKSSLFTKRAIYRDDASVNIISSVQNSPVSSQTSPSLLESEISAIPVSTSNGTNNEPEERTRTSRDRFKCDFCDYHGTRDGMVKHVKAFHSEKYDKWRCNQTNVLSIRCASCDWFFANLDDLSSHQRTIHPIKKMSFDQSLKKNEDNAKHMATRHSLLKLCSEMKRRAEYELAPVNAGKKRLHSNDVNPKENRQPSIKYVETPPANKIEAFFAGTITECPYSTDGSKCDYNGKSNQMLEVHVSHKHTNKWDHYMRSIDKPYECDVCNWRYGSLQQLKKHKTKYSKICGAFPQYLSEDFLSKVSRDILFTESDPDLLPLETNPLRGFIIDDLIRADETKCPYDLYFHCKYNFKSNLLLERHVNTYHLLKYNEFMTIVDRPLQCESCNYRFDCLTLLRLHKKQKEGVCDSYDVTNEELYYRVQTFTYPKVPLLDDNENHKLVDTVPNKKKKLVVTPQKKITLEISNFDTTWRMIQDSNLDGEKSADEDDTYNFTANDTVKGVDLKIKNWGVRLKMKTISPLLKCSFCGLEFNIDEDKDASFKLVQHVADSHPDENIKFRTTSSSLLPYQCSACSFCFVNQKSLADHKCNSMIKYSCCLCEELICEVNLKLLSKGVKQHFTEKHPNKFSVLRTTRSALYSVECKCCGIYFTTRNKLQNHQMKIKCFPEDAD